MSDEEVVYICNALDSHTKSERGITTDSPAATNKVLGLCRALHGVGVRASVLSMGRGRQRGTFVFYPSVKRCFDNVPLYYVSFWDVPIFSHVVSAISLLRWFVFSGKMSSVVLVAYNRFWHYIPLLFFANLFKVRCYLDLEDGFDLPPGVFGKLLAWIYNFLCHSGCLIACEALGGQVQIRKKFICYGVADEVESLKAKDWLTGPLRVLYGGTLGRDMGVGLFIEAVRLLMAEHPFLENKIKFVVTGKGSMAWELKCFAENEARGWVDFRGDVSGDEYLFLRSKSHVGISLNLPSSGLRDTVFPSKVIGLAANGLLVVATRTSDVPKVFSLDEAILLLDESPKTLADAFCWIECNRGELSSLAVRGRNAVLRCCSSEEVGGRLVKFLGVGGGDES